jgi:hypothetical protein
MYNINSRHTNCYGKISTEQKTYNVIGNIIDSNKSDKWWIGLVGKIEVFSRHIMMCQRLGIPSQKMIIIERDENIYLSLEEENKRNRYGCIIICGDFFEELSKYLSLGYFFSFVDFDATSPLSKYEINLIDLYEQHKDQIEVLRIVTSVRENKIDPFYINLNENLNLGFIYRALYMDKEIRSKILNQCDIPSVISRIVIDSNSTSSLPIYTKSCFPKNFILKKYCDSKGFYCLYENYKGVSRMRNILISSNKTLMDYQNIIHAKEKLIDADIFNNQIKKLVTDHELTLFYRIGQEIYHKHYGLIAKLN